MRIPVGYVYEVVNLINEKTYVGRRNLNRDKSWRQYLGSGKIINQAIEKYGEENFVKRFLEYANTVDDLADLETEWIQRRKDEGFAQYNIFTSGHAGGDTFSKLKSKDLEEIRKKQSKSIRNSEKHKESMYRKRQRRIQEDNRIRLQYSTKIVQQYLNTKSTMDELAKMFQIPRRLVREILVENKVALNNQTAFGRIMPEEQKETISKALSSKNSSRKNINKLPSTCNRDKCSNLIDYNKPNKMFCSSECLSIARKQKRFDYLASIEKDFKKAYLEDRLSCAELQKMFSCKQRSIYYLIDDFGLPTFSQR